MMTGGDASNRDGRCQVWAVEHPRDDETEREHREPENCRSLSERLYRSTEVAEEGTEETEEDWTRAPFRTQTPAQIRRHELRWHRLMEPADSGLAHELF